MDPIDVEHRRNELYLKRSAGDPQIMGDGIAFKQATTDHTALVVVAWHFRHGRRYLALCVTIDIRSVQFLVNRSG